MYFKLLLIALTLSGLVGCAGTPTNPSQGPIRFVVIGDTPYSNRDKIMLETAKLKIHQGNYPFVIHIGDYKGGGAACTDEHDRYQLELIKALAPLPVFYTPGDNEWTDCDRFDNPETGGKYSELDRLEVVRALFFKHAPRNTSSLKYRTQKNQKENATWKYGGIRFATLNVPGTNNGRDWVGGDSLTRTHAAANKRDAANLVWLDRIFDVASREKTRAIVIAIHGDITNVDEKPEDKMCTDMAATGTHDCDGFTDFRKVLQTHALATTVPILLIHGDTAPFTLNQKIAGEDAPNLWRLNAAGDAGIGRTGQPYGVHDVTLVTIDSGQNLLFSAQGLVTQKQAKN